MRSLFLRIFLWFWVTLIAVVAVLVVFSPLLTQNPAAAGAVGESRRRLGRGPSRTSRAIDPTPRSGGPWRSTGEGSSRAGAHDAAPGSGLRRPRERGVRATVGRIGSAPGAAGSRARATCGSAPWRAAPVGSTGDRSDWGAARSCRNRRIGRRDLQIFSSRSSCSLDWAPLQALPVCSFSGSPFT